MHRLIRLTTVIAAVLLLLSGVRLQFAAAQSENGVMSDTTYVSPTFGYEVAWSGEWYVLEDATETTDNGDALALFNDTYGARVDISSFFASDRSPQEFLEGYEVFLAENYEDYESEPVSSADRDSVAILGTYRLGELLIDDYLEVRQVGEALVLTSVKAGEGLAVVVAALAIVDIEIDGDPLLPSFGAGDDTDDATPEPDGAYVAPTFGVSLAYDPDAWTVTDQHEADAANGRDLLVLESEDVAARVFLEAYDSETRAKDCLDSASAEAVGELEGAEPIEDENGDVIADSSRGVAFAAYRFETDDGDAVAAYIECRALPGGVGVFVITLIAAEEDFEPAFEALEPILDSIDLDGGSASNDTNDDDEETSTPDENEGEEVAQAAGASESAVPRRGVLEMVVLG